MLTLKTKSINDKRTTERVPLLSCQVIVHIKDFLMKTMTTQTPQKSAHFSSSKNSELIKLPKTIAKEYVLNWETVTK